jgi:hypothetical protein
MMTRPGASDRRTLTRQEPHLVEAFSRALRERRVSRGNAFCLTKPANLAMLLAYDF